MKKILLVIVCLFVVLATVSAQQGNRGNRGGTPEENAKRTTEWMKTELKLTAKQVAPVDSINLVIAKAQAKLRESANGNFSSMREANQKLEDDRVKAFEKVLTKEQLEGYKKQMQERRRNRPQRNN